MDGYHRLLFPLLPAFKRHRLHMSTARRCAKRELFLSCLCQKIKNGRFGVLFFSLFILYSVWEYFNDGGGGGLWCKDIRCRPTGKKGEQKSMDRVRMRLKFIGRMQRRIVGDERIGILWSHPSTKTSIPK